MALYWILILCCAAVGIPVCGLYKKAPAKRAWIFCGIFAAVFTVVAALRLSVGVDYNSYATGFYNMNFMSYEDLANIRTEKGMYFPVKIVELFTYDYFPSFVVLSVIIYPIIMTYAAKYSDNPWIGTFAFLAFGVFFNSLNFMRQIIAALIGGYALKYAEKGSFLRFFILVITAGAFHRSAFMLIPCYIFAFISMNIPTLILTLLTSVSAFLLSTDIMKMVTSRFYKSYDVTSTYVEAVKGLNPMYCIMYGAIFVLAFLLRTRLHGSEREKNVLLWCSYCSFFFELIGIHHAIVSRVALLFFFPTVFLVVPKVFCAACELARDKLPKNISRIGSAVTAAVLAGMMCFVYGGLLSRNYNSVLPYKTIFERGAAESGE